MPKITIKINVCDIIIPLRYCSDDIFHEIIDYIGDIIIIKSINTEFNTKFNMKIIINNILTLIFYKKHNFNEILFSYENINVKSSGIWYIKEQIDLYVILQRLVSIKLIKFIH